MSMQRFHRSLTQGPDASALFIALQRLRNIHQCMKGREMQTFEGYLRCSPVWRPGG